MDVAGGLRLANVTGNAAKDVFQVPNQKFNIGIERRKLAKRTVVPSFW